MITALACLICSGFYLDVAGVVADSGVERYGVERNTYTIAKGGVVESGWSEHYGYSREAQNPYVRFTIGFEHEFAPRWTAYSEASHTSSIATGRDHGVNSLVIGVRWFPFGASR